MMTLDLFLYALLVVSVITGLTVQALKNHIKTNNYYAVSAVVSIIVAIFVSIFFAVTHLVTLDATFFMMMVCLTFLSWLVSQLGYDKVKDMIIMLINMRGGLPK